MKRLTRWAIAAVAAIAAMSPVGASAQLGAVKSYRAYGSEATFETQTGRLTLTAYGDSIIRVLPQLDVALQPKASASVVRHPAGIIEVTDAGDFYEARCGALTARVDKMTAMVTFVADGRTLLAENEAVKLRGADKVYSFANDGRAAIYGAGERGHKLNLQGDTLIMFNKQNYGYGLDGRERQMNITMPYFVSTDGYSVFFDDYSMSELTLGNPIEYVTHIKQPVAYYVMLGSRDNLSDATARFTSLVGRQELPPFWSLGYIMSRYGYVSAAAADAAIDSLKTAGYPCDGIVLDLYWYGTETDMGRFEWDKKKWPEPEKMLARWKEKGIKCVTISQPYLNKIGAIDNYNDLASRGMLAIDSLGKVHDVHTWVGDAGMLDVTNAATRQWMWERYRRSLDQGVAALWGDLGEPEVHPLSIRHSNGETAAEYHNRYGNDWCNIIFSGTKTYRPNTRQMLLMRGGTAGLQRYSVFPWSTDVGRSWGGMVVQVPIMINSALSGLGYMSSDVGGFAVDPANPVDAELYARWLEMGLFIPTMRTHSTVKAEPYNYPEYADLFLHLVKERYAWLPYNYTLAATLTINGTPFVRPMNYFDAQNRQLADVADQYYWGDNVIVAPVMKKGAVRRTVVVPEGKWYDYNRPNVAYTGPATINYEAPVGTLPLLVKAGSFLPRADYAMNSTDDYDPSRYTVHFYPTSGNSAYQLYEDNREAADAITAGNFVIVNFMADNATDALKLTTSLSGEGYAGMPTERVITYVVHDIDAPRQVKIDRKKVQQPKDGQLAAGTYLYDAAARTLRVCVAFSRGTTIEVHK